jgi:hypothetical protein
MCLTSGTEPFNVVGVISANDSWTVGRLLEGQFRILATGQLEGIDVVAGDPLPVTLECAVTAEGDRTALWVDGQLVADITTDARHGPYAAVGAWADATTSGATSRFDDAVVLIGDPAGPVGTLGADILVFEDDFATTKEWGTGRTRQARVSDANGALRFRFSRPGSVWSAQQYAEPLPVVGLEATFRVRQGSGALGILCSRPGEPLSFYYGILDTNDEVVVGRSVDSVLTELARVALPDGVARSDRARVAVECGVTGPDADRVVVWVNGVPVLDHTTSGSFGSFDQVALYGSSAGRRFEFLADDAVMTAGLTYAPGAADAPVEE